jgi:hypothetical protein
MLVNGENNAGQDQRANDVTVEDIVLDGNRDENGLAGSDFSGAVFIQNRDRWSFRNVKARNQNADASAFRSAITSTSRTAGP